MKVEINKSVLLEGLNKVARVVSARPAIPVLGGILLDVKEDGITLTGSDSTETIIHTIPVDGESVNVIRPGSIVLQRQIVAIVRKLNKTILLDLDELTLKLTSGNSEFNLNCLDSLDYPKINSIQKDKPSAILEGEQFQNFVSKTSFAASESDMRPVLQGIHYKVENNCLHIVCTDSHRLAQVSQELSDSEEGMNLVVPAKSLDNALRVFDLKSSIEFYVEDGNLLLMRNGQTEYFTRLIEGNYPETARLIPDSFLSVMAVDRKDFINSLELIGGIANTGDDSTRGVAEMRVNGDIHLSSSRTETGKGEISLPYESLEGEQEFVLSFTINYAIDSLKALTSDVVEFKYTGDTRPFLITPEDKVLDELQLVLPVRTF